MSLRYHLAPLLAAAALLMPGLALAIPEGPAYPSPEWIQREVQNYARTLEAPIEEVSNPDFVLRMELQSTTNMVTLTQRNLSDPSWNLVSSPLLTALLAALSNPAAATQALQDTVALLQQDPTKAVALPLNTPVLPLCTSWSQPCVGDPYRYAEADGPDGNAFYSEEADVRPVVFYDDGCARLSGRVWAPKGSDTAKLPAVVIENGSIEAPEPLYWWAAQMLVRNGYVVMTFDPRGQGRSDQQSPTGGQGTNINPSVFWTGLVNAIDFFRSTPEHPYPHNETCAGTYPTVVAPYNPLYGRIDRERLGLAGHSLGARGVSIVQGYGAKGAAPWPGLLDAKNPVDVIVAWDGLSAPDGGDVAETTNLERVAARVPAMGHSSEYGIGGAPFLQPPDPEEHKAGFTGWQQAGVPSYEIIIQGSTHFEWSLIPLFPATSWCADTSHGHCEGGWGNPMAQHYTLAWLDRWLKKPGEPGYFTADRRLLADDDWHDRYSFYFRSARDFPDRGGREHVCEDIRAGCNDTRVASSSGRSDASTGSNGGGGAFDAGVLALALLLLGRRLARRS